MDVTAPKTGHAANTLSSAVSKSGEKGKGGGAQAISFTTILKTNGDIFKTGGNRNGLASHIDRDTDYSEAPEAPQRHDYEDSAPRETRHDRHDDDAYDGDEPATSHRHDDRGDRDAAPRSEQTETAHHDLNGQADRDGAHSRENGSHDTAPDNAEPHQQGETATESQVQTVESAQQNQASMQTAEGAVKTAGASDATGLEGLEKAQSAPGQGVENAPGQDVAAQAVAAAAQKQAGAQGKSDAKGESKLGANAAQPVAQAGSEGKTAKPETATEKPVGDLKGTAMNDSAAQTKKQTPPQVQTQTVHGPAKPEANAAQQAQQQAQDIKPQQTTNVAQQQAQDLSQRLGPNANVKVEVSVNDEAKSLTSRPTASLAQSDNGASKNGQSSQGQAQAQNSHALTPQQLQAQQSQQQAMQQQAAAQVQASQGQAAKAATTPAASQSANSVHGVGATAAGQAAADGAAQTASTHGGQHAQQSQQAQAAQKPQQTPQMPHNRAALDQVNVQITKALKAGADKINIQLKPASLGRVDVQLEVKDGHVTATIVADSKDTLDVLKNGARDLTRALNNAGLETGGQDLNFNLRENNQEQAKSGAQGKDEALDFSEGDSSVAADDETTTSGPRNIVQTDRVDIHA